MAADRVPPLPQQAGQRRLGPGHDQHDARLAVGGAGQEPPHPLRLGAVARRAGRVAARRLERHQRGRLGQQRLRQHAGTRAVQREVAVRDRVHRDPPPVHPARLASRRPVASSSTTPRPVRLASASTTPAAPSIRGGPRQRRRGRDGTGHGCGAPARQRRLERGRRRGGLDAAGKGEQRQRRLVRLVPHARERARQVVAVDEHQPGSARRRQPHDQVAPLAAAGDAGPPRDDQIARPDLQAGARADVADDDPRDDAVETGAAGQEPAPGEEAGAGEVADPQVAVVHSHKLYAKLLSDRLLVRRDGAAYASGTRGGGVMRILKRMHGRGLVVLAVLGLTAAVTAIAPLASADDPPATNDWRVGYDQEFDNNLNPFAAQFTSDYFVFTEVYDLLLNFKISDNSPDLENSPAQSFESSPDGKVWTYKLRPGIKWADGVPFTADDVVWTLQTVSTRPTTPATCCPATCPTPDKIEKIDDLTVKITLPEPNVRMSSLYIPILPKHIWEKADPKKIKDFDPFTEITDATTGEKKKAIIGTGPFMVTKLDKKGTTILERNPYFYGPKGEIDRMLMVKYGDKDPQLRDIKLGQPRRDPVRQPQVGDGRGGQQGHHDLVLPEPGLLGDRVQLVHGRRRVALHRRRQGRQEGRRPGSGDPARAVLRAEPARGAEDGAPEPGHRRQRPHLAVLRQRYYQDFSKDPEIGYQYDPAKAKQVLADGRLELPGGRHVHQERRARPSSSCSSARTTRTTRTPRSATRPTPRRSGST